MSVADCNVFKSFLIHFKLLIDHFEEEELLMLCDIMEISGHGPDATDNKGRVCIICQLYSEHSVPGKRFFARGIMI